MLDAILPITKDGVRPFSMKELSLKQSPSIVSSK
jgi:hypothetical protein